jgi:hypothetical protein
MSFLDKYQPLVLVCQIVISYFQKGQYCHCIVLCSCKLHPPELILILIGNLLSRIKQFMDIMVHVSSNVFQLRYSDQEPKCEWGLEGGFHGEVVEREIRDLCLHKSYILKIKSRTIQ